eukprot:m.341252 g.341252  ORF g.341252 m.341252 type:complete len:188 (-) comp19959_c0_seq1:1318-1881(-)
MGLLRAKCVIVGDAASGKSSITQVLHSDGTHFPEKYNMTTSVEYCVKVLSPSGSSDNVELHLFDSAGKDAFMETAKHMWQNPSFVVLVFDVCSEASFSSLESWKERVAAENKGTQIKGMVLGNKIDLELQRVVTLDRAQDLANKLGFDYFEVSAKTGENLENAFSTLATNFIDSYKDATQTIETGLQ